MIPAVGDPVRMAPYGGVVLRAGMAKLAGPRRNRDRDQRGGLIERDADPLFLAPDDVARPLHLF